MTYRFAVFVSLIVISSSLVAGFMGLSVAADPDPLQNSPSDFLKNFTEVIEIIEKNHVDNVRADQLVYSAIKGMLRKLDPHSSFFDPNEFFRLREDQHSKYFGLGIRVRPLLRDRGRVVIVEPPSIGSPAEKRGLRAGDVITEIEGESIDDWTSDEVVNNLRGPRGTEVNITVERPGLRTPLQFRVERDEIPIITVPYAFEVKPGVGYIKVDRFSESTADELKRRLNEVEAEKFDGLILDLRDNPGGLLNQAIDVSDLFTARGELIVSTKGRLQGTARTYKSPGPEEYGVPLIILINRHSASASEIVAGALQDHDRALIVGETSFGKGLVQSVYTLENNTGMALTTAEYFTPSGRLIQRDYSGSSFEYYYLSNTGDMQADKDRKTFRTDSGRIVYGGGGITPDVIEPMGELNRFEALLSSKDIFFEYARRLTSGQVAAASDFELPATNSDGQTPRRRTADAMPNLEITDAILEDFKSYLKERTVEFTESEILENVQFIKRRIKQEVYTSSFGLQEGAKIRIQGDNQVSKALELLSEAKSLMTTGQMSVASKNPAEK